MANITKLTMVFFLIILAVLFRTVFRIGPNVEFITAATLLSAYYCGKKWAFITPLVALFLSDIIIGNTNIVIFTWSAYLILGLVSNAFFEKYQKSNIKSQNHKLKIKIVIPSILGVGASVWFYLWTNFGVWILDSWGMYDATFFGLIQSYVMGLPFLKYNLIGNIVFVPLSFTIIEVIRLYKTQQESRIFH